MPDHIFSLIEILVVNSYYAFDGCSSNPLSAFDDDPPGYLSELSKAHIVCCSLDGNSCSRKNGDFCRLERDLAQFLLPLRKGLTFQSEPLKWYLDHFWDLNSDARVSRSSCNQIFFK